MGVLFFRDFLNKSLSQFDDIHVIHNNNNNNGQDSYCAFSDRQSAHKLSILYSNLVSFSGAE